MYGTPHCGCCNPKTTSIFTLRNPCAQFSLYDRERHLVTRGIVGCQILQHVLIVPKPLRRRQARSRASHHFLITLMTASSLLPDCAAQLTE
ncbi:hypothetical protein WAI453_000896 [Rhynchosporium graminicola]